MVVGEPELLLYLAEEVEGALVDLKDRLGVLDGVTQEFLGLSSSPRIMLDLYGSILPLASASAPPRRRRTWPTAPCPASRSGRATAPMVDGAGQVVVLADACSMAFRQASQPSAYSTSLGEK